MSIEKCKNCPNEGKHYCEKCEGYFCLSCIKGEICKECSLER